MNTVHWILWLAVGVLAIIGLAWVLAKVADGIERAWGWLVRDRVADLLEEDGEEFTCECCEALGYGSLQRLAGGYCTGCAHWHGELNLPPERTWEQMTSHQLPVVGMSPAERKDWQRRETARKKRAKRAEMTHRAHYMAMGFDYPSGLMARVRELTP